MTQPSLPQRDPSAEQTAIDHCIQGLEAAQKHGERGFTDKALSTMEASIKELSLYKACRNLSIENEPGLGMLLIQRFRSKGKTRIRVNAKSREKLLDYLLERLDFSANQRRSMMEANKLEATTAQPAKTKPLRTQRL